MLPSGIFVPKRQPAVCDSMMVWANQLVRSSGPSTVSLKSFCALTWSSQLIGGISSEAAIPAFLNASVTSGAGCRPRRDLTRPSRNSNQRPVPSSRALICATRLRSRRRAAKAGCRRRASFSACARPNKMTGKVAVANGMVSSRIPMAHAGPGSLSRPICQRLAGLSTARMAVGGLTQARSAVYAARQDPDDCTELPAVFGVEGGGVAPLGLRPRWNCPCAAGTDVIRTIRSIPGRDVDAKAVGGGQEGLGQGQGQMGQLPEAVAQAEARRPQELVVSLQVHVQLTRRNSRRRARSGP